MTQRLRRKSISQPGPVKGDQTWAEVGWEDGNGEGVEERERWPREQLLQERKEGGRLEGAAVQADREQCGGVGRERGVTMTHTRNTRTADTGVLVGTRKAPPQHPNNLETRMGVCGGSQRLFQS